MKILAILSITLLTFTTTAFSAPKKLTCTIKNIAETSNGTFKNETVIDFFIGTDDFSKEQPFAEVVLKKLYQNNKPFDKSSSLIDKKFRLPYKVTPTTLSLTYYYAVLPTYKGNVRVNEKWDSTLDIDRKTLSFKDGNCSIEDVDTSNNLI